MLVIGKLKQKKMRVIGIAPIGVAHIRYGVLLYETSFEKLKTRLVYQHGLVNVEEALWMKPKRGNNAQSLSFKS